MDDEQDPTNVFKFGTFKGGKETEESDVIPQSDYFVKDIDDNEFDVNGFLIFTPHHLAIMRDEGQGAVPALVMPINRVKIAILASFLDDDD